MKWKFSQIYHLQKVRKVICSNITKLSNITNLIAKMGKTIGQDSRGRYIFTEEYKVFLHNCSSHSGIGRLNEV